MDFDVEKEASKLAERLRPQPCFQDSYTRKLTDFARRAIAATEERVEEERSTWRLKRRRYREHIRNMQAACERWKRLYEVVVARNLLRCEQDERRRRREAGRGEGEG